MHFNIYGVSYSHVLHGENIMDINKIRHKYSSALLVIYIVAYNRIFGSFFVK